MKQLSLQFDENSINQQKIKQKLNLTPDQQLLDGLAEEEKIDWLNYLYSDPKPDSTTLTLRNHLISLYDPFASRAEFPAGRRWCINVYTGCAFACKYCYIISYIRDAFHPRVKNQFDSLLLKDLAEIVALNLHPAPVHISNSTDPLQPLEKIHKHTLTLLQSLAAHRKHFTIITILTKNPERLMANEYLDVIRGLKGFQVEVTCPFFHDEPRRFFEPGAPPIESRLNAIEKLRAQGITVALRIDPIFPRAPLPRQFFASESLDDYGALPSQTEDDLDKLVRFAAAAGCSRIIVSPLKLTTGRFINSELIPRFSKLYQAANHGKLVRKGSAYRMPWALYNHWIEKPRTLAESLGIPFVYCKDNLFTTY